MKLGKYHQQTLKQRLIVFSIATVLFILSFVFNIIYSTPLYNIDLNVIPQLQQNSSHGLMVFMNLVSLVFDPMVCAGYIFIIYLISYRKFEILIFLVWFFLLSWILGFLKMVIHQGRPFWVPGTQVQMQSWTCYTDYGSPSGHSMLAIVILQFLLRFYARIHQFLSKYIVFFYILIFLIELLVMFSRVILGMHSLNQVVFGLSIGMYSFVPYYLFMENFITKGLIYIVANARSAKVNAVALFLVVKFTILSVVIALLPIYDQNDEFYAVITQTQGCSKVKYQKSFQYACLFGTAIIFAGIGVIMGLSYMNSPQNLQKQLSYSRLSVKFIGKLIITVVSGLVPIVIFLNPLWDEIQTSYDGFSVIRWVCSSLGFFFGIFFILVVATLISQKCGLQTYKYPNSYSDYKKFEVLDMMPMQNTEIVVQKPRPRETELSISRK